MFSSNKKQNTKDPGSQKLLQIVNGPTEKTFMKYYEQNIRLKKQLQQKKNIINDLKKKLQNQMNLNRTTNPYAQLNQLKNQLKKQGPVRPQSTNKKGGKTFYNTMTGNGQTKKVQNLLQIIEHYKSKLMLSQQECANLRRQKTLLQQDLHIKQKVHRDFSVDPNAKIQEISKQQELKSKLRKYMNQLQIQKQNNLFLNAQSKRLQAKLDTLLPSQEEIRSLKNEIRIWQQRVLRLTMISNNTQGNDIRSIEQKNKELELKLKNGMEKYSQLKQKNIKLEFDNKLQSNRLIQLTYANQQLQKQNITLKKNEINDPIIQKLLKNKDLLVKVVGQLQKPKTALGQQALNPNQTAQKLIFQKQELARELVQAKNKIKLMQQTWRQKQALNKLEKQQLLNRVSLVPTTNKNATYTSKQGIPYDGDISMFSDEKISIAAGVNYFDVYLGDINLIQSIVKSIANISSGSNPLIMGTVDFYNFGTQNTKLTQGLTSNLNSQFTFKIAEDQFFYKYLSKGSLKIDIWASEGNKNHHLGVVEVPLKQLFLKNKPNISPVLNSSAPIIMNQKVVGTIHFDIRMRLPIYEQVSKVIDSNMAGQYDQKYPKRKLVIQIQEGNGFNPSSNLFVYYPFRFEDFYTKTSKGPQPKWSHYKMIDLTYNQEIKNYLKKNQLQFTVFDDNAVLYDQKDNDVIGSASLPLINLVDVENAERPIKQKLQIKKNGMKMGWINVKVFWYETKEKLQNKQTKKNQDIFADLHQDILNYIKNRNSTPQMEFKRIDFNGTGMVSYQQFSMWVTKVKQSHKYSQDVFSKYYDSFKQPLNLINWTQKMRHKTEQQKRPQDLMQQLGMINQILRKNSVQIRNQVSLREFLKDKKILDVTLQIDQDNNGKISKKQLLKYMKQHNIQLDQSQIESQQIRLVDFLKKYTNE